MHLADVDKKIKLHSTTKLTLADAYQRTRDFGHCRIEINVVHTAGMDLVSLPAPRLSGLDECSFSGVTLIRQGNEFFFAHPHSLGTPQGMRVGEKKLKKYLQIHAF